jgi:asparagine synthase (glutamine-hydrolysing)
MCAICGIVSTDREDPITESTFLRMRDSMSHRGPDDAGHYIAPGIALGSLRLAILDLSERGHMPMSTMDGRYRIIHNGEIYNYRELRSGLQRQGYSFQSNTDTEVLLKLYAVEGPAMLDRLNGMFAFAIWDCEERTLFIARDRLGIKPLYYSYHKGALYFASEEKALFAAGVPLLFDHTAWEELLCFRYVAGEFTPFTDIRRLLPGHFLLWRDGQVRSHRWWNLAEKVQVLRERLPEDPVSWFRETFDDSVNLRRISDVPVGVLLSGGLDSSTVAASLAEQGGHGTATFTVRFEEVDYDEGPLARQVAVRCGLESYELFVNPENLLDQLRHAAWFNDEPQVHGNDLHLLAVSQYAKSKVTVLLSGEGADELLGGYVRYQPLKHASALSIARLVMPALRGTLNLSGRWHKLARFLELDSLGQFVLFNACEILPSDLTSLGLAGSPQFAFRADVLNEARSLYPKDLARQAMYSDQHTFLCSVLDRNDRMTMGASIECRVPFLDYRLVEVLAALPSSVLFRGRKSKGLLRAALGSRLPSSILRHRKWGFGVPWKQYLRQVPELRVLLSDLPNNQLIMQSPLRRAVLEEQVKDFLAGVDQPFPLLMQLLMTTLSWESVNRLQCRTLKAVNAARMDVLDTSNAV